MSAEVRRMLGGGESHLYLSQQMLASIIWPRVGACVATCDAQQTICFCSPEYYHHITTSSY